MQQAARVSDYTAFLYIGELVEFGTTTNFRNPDEKQPRITSPDDTAKAFMHKHISEQYDVELSQIRDTLMEMAGLVEVQANNACTSLVNHDMELAEEVRDVEARLNQFEVELDDQCVHHCQMATDRWRPARHRQCNESHH